MFQQYITQVTMNSQCICSLTTEKNLYIYHVQQNGIKRMHTQICKVTKKIGIFRSEYKRNRTFILNYKWLELIRIAEQFSIYGKYTHARDTPFSSRYFIQSGKSIIYKCIRMHGERKSSFQVNKFQQNVIWMYCGRHRRTIASQWNKKKNESIELCSRIVCEHFITSKSNEFYKPRIVFNSELLSAGLAKKAMHAYSWIRTHKELLSDEKFNCTTQPQKCKHLYSTLKCMHKQFHIANCSVL